jgi:hypothetical protein
VDFQEKRRVNHEPGARDFARAVWIFIELSMWPFIMGQTSGSLKTLGMGRNVQDLRYHCRSLVRSGTGDAIEVNTIHFNIE